MIEKMEISGVHTEVSDDLHRYVGKKIGKLDRYIPRRARQSAHVEVKLKEATIKKRKQYTCDVVMYLPHETIATKETTLNMFAAVDIVETKLKNQLKRYKGQHSIMRHHTRRLVKRIHSSEGA